MADFGTALTWMKEGKRIRRPMWNRESYCYMSADGETIFQANPPGRNNVMTTWPTPAVMANDWEVVLEHVWREGDIAYIKVRVSKVHSGLLYDEFVGVEIPGSRYNYNSDYVMERNNLLTPSQVHRETR